VCIYGLMGAGRTELLEAIVGRVPMVAGQVLLNGAPLVGLKKAGSQVANWDRTRGHDKMQNLLQANPNIIGMISGNDEMAVGAIAALKKAGKLSSIKVGGFDGSPDAVGR
jgi:ABC-type sugar transport system substrate-binding protein